jgi:hypothetical protein
MFRRQPPQRRPVRRTAPRHRLGLFDHLEDRMAPAVLTVTNTNDSGPGSLRAAIEAANAAPDADTIDFILGPGQKTIDLRTADATDLGPSALAISSPVTLVAGGQVTIARDPAVPNLRLFDVENSGLDHPAGNLTLENLTLADGVAAPSGAMTDAMGGAILCELAGRGNVDPNGFGVATLAGCKLLNNRADASAGGDAFGGAISGICTLDRCTLSGNQAIAAGAAWGGAVCGGATIGAIGDQSVVIRDSTLEDNAALNPVPGGGATGTAAGGAVAVSPDGTGYCTISGCTLSGNSADGGAQGAGGAIALTSSFTVVGSFFEAVQDSLTLTNSTLWMNTAHNLASSDSGGIAGGGALDNGGGVAAVTQCTFADNSVTGPAVDGTSGMAIHNHPGPQPPSFLTPLPTQLTLVNSIVVGLAGAADLGNEQPATVTATAPNIVGSVSNTGTLDGSGIVSADPKLGPLADNGGPTMTFTLLPGSPALDAGTAAGTPPEDQRGAARDGRPDLGAFELVSPLAPLGVPSDLFGPRPNSNSNQAFVKGLYHAAVQRDADPGSLAAYTGLLDAGLVTTARVAQSVYNSTEARQAQVTNFYGAVLHRAPDAPSLAAYVAALQAGADEGSLLEGLFGAAEFAPAGDNGAFLDNLYVSVLGRNPDAPSFNADEALLAAGRLTRPQLAEVILRSAESAERAGSAMIRTYLQRAPDAGTLGAMAQGVGAGVPYGVYAVIFLGSQEFFDHARAATP